MTRFIIGTKGEKLLNGFRKVVIHNVPELPKCGKYNDTVLPDEANNCSLCGSPLNAAGECLYTSLIASAADMLKVCKMILNDENMDDMTAVQLLTEVIAKAEGSAPDAER